MQKRKAWAKRVCAKAHPADTYQEHHPRQSQCEECLRADTRENKTNNGKQAQEGQDAPLGCTSGEPRVGRHHFIIVSFLL